MSKIYIKIYEATAGNRWGDFILRNRKVYGYKSYLKEIIRKIRKKILKQKDTFLFSRKRIEKLARDPALLPPRKLFKLSQKNKIFIIGCCFSRYIRSILEQIGFDMYPKFLTLKFDPTLISVATIPKKYSLAWYNTFTVKQEFDKVFSLWKQGQDDIWTLENNSFLWERYPQFKGKTIYADPYRRHIFSIDKAVLNRTLKDIDSLFKEGIEKSDIFIITLGLTDVWRKLDSGQICCAMPNFFNFEDKNLCELILGTYEDNYRNLKSIVSNLNKNFPDKKVVFMVAPVALAATFTENDIYIATEESKSILKAAAIKVSREFDNVYYFPSLEIFQLMALSTKNKSDLFNKSMRNLSMPAVEKIMAHFFKIYYEFDECTDKVIKFDSFIDD